MKRIFSIKMKYHPDWRCKIEIDFDNVEAMPYIRTSVNFWDDHLLWVDEDFIQEFLLNISLEIFKMKVAGYSDHYVKTRGFTDKEGYSDKLDGTKFGVRLISADSITFHSTDLEVDEIEG